MRNVNLIPNLFFFVPKLWNYSSTSSQKHNQSGRSPEVVALFSATNFSRNITELFQLYDTIQIKWNYA